MSKRYSSQDAILDHLKNNKYGITSAEAFTLYGVTRLSAVIFNLRRKGYAIETDTLDTKTRYGYYTQYARYYLVEEEK